MKEFTMTHTAPTLALAFVALAGSTGLALAHAHLKSAVPAVGKTVASSPAAIAIDFSEGVNLSFTGATLTGPNDVAVKTGQKALKAGSDNTLIVPVTGTLKAGTYTVSWHALSTDGHKTHGTYHFTVK